MREESRYFFFILCGIVEASVNSSKISHVKRSTEIYIKLCHLTGACRETDKTVKAIGIVGKLKIILHAGFLVYIARFCSHTSKIDNDDCVEPVI